MKDERRAAEELASASQYLTEITLPLGLPDYSTALEDSKRRKHIGWHEHTRNLHTHTEGPRVQQEAAAATLYPGQIWTLRRTVYVSASASVLHKVCVGYIQEEEIHQTYQ